MAASRREQVIGKILERLSAIKTADGFQTDAGAGPVWHGQNIELGDDDPDAVLGLAIGDEIPTGSLEKLTYDLPIEIQAVIKANLANPTLTIEAMVGDIKRAIEKEDRTLGRALDGSLLVNGNGNHGLIRGGVASLPREPGSSTVGAGVVYRAKLVEVWGQP